MGGALVQLAKRRGARAIAMASAAKHAEVATLGPDLILPRAPEDLRGALAGETVTVVADVVGGPGWPALIDILARGGRYTCSGAIAGPMVTLDLRSLYLRDLTFTGSTVVPGHVFRDVVGCPTTPPCVSTRSATRTSTGIVAASLRGRQRISPREWPAGKPRTAPGRSRRAVRGVVAAFDREAAGSPAYLNFGRTEQPVQCRWMPIATSARA